MQPGNSNRLGSRAYSTNGVELPLSGVKVIEICQIAAGPFCGMLLGDLGADVIKIEPPNGDAMRQWPPISGGFSENFASVQSKQARHRTGSEISRTSPNSFRACPTSRCSARKQSSWCNGSPRTRIRGGLNYLSRIDLLFDISLRPNGPAFS